MRSSDHPPALTEQIVEAKALLSLERERIVALCHALDGYAKEPRVAPHAQRLLLATSKNLEEVDAQIAAFLAELDGGLADTPGSWLLIHDSLFWLLKRSVGVRASLYRNTPPLSGAPPALHWSRSAHDCCPATQQAAFHLKQRTKPP